MTLREILTAFHPQIDMEKVLLGTEEHDVDSWLMIVHGITLDTELVEA